MPSYKGSPLAIEKLREIAKFPFYSMEEPREYSITTWCKITSSKLGNIAGFRSNIYKVTCSPPSYVRFQRGIFRYLEWNMWNYTKRNIPVPGMEYVELQNMPKAYKFSRVSIQLLK